MVKKVLVVDKEVKLREILQKVLSERGYAVELAQNGKEALKMIPDFSPHLVIAEVALPEMDGFELCRRIREDKRFGALRFIFLTAKDAREDEIEGLRLGADDYITKPFDVDRLLARVETRLRWLDAAKDMVCGEVRSECIEGGLAGRNLIDVLQILEMSQKKGRLTVTNESKKVILTVDQGSILSASFGNKRGKFAVFEALSWVDGRFRFEPVSEASEVKGEDNLSITGILLEWARIADEIGQGPIFPTERAAETNGVAADFIRYVKEREGK
ncbi:response regulator [candidate division WOR-3 bacterium]|nr:response regulator [candidate division WOR-3 bacterium]